LGFHPFRIPFVVGAKGHARDLPSGQIARAAARSPRYFRRPSAPSVRLRQARMGRSVFLRIVGCWILGVLVLLVLAFAIRFIS